MDPRERQDDLREAIRTAVNRGLSHTWTALPVRVLEDSDGFTVRLQPTIQGKEMDRKTGQQHDVDMPPLGQVPVQFSAGGGFTLTHPIKAGDEGIAIFSSRCIDAWHDQGGVQPQMWQRRHHLSDAMYIPGIRSKPRRLGGENGDGRMRDGSASRPVSTTSVQLRSDSGEFFIELGPEGAVNIVAKTITITASDKVHIDTPRLEVTGEVIAKDGDDSVRLSQHRHRDVESGQGESGAPVPGS